MILIGNTSSSVRAYLTNQARTELSRTGQRHHIGRHDESLHDIRATSPLERRLLGHLCPRCGAKTWLCFAPTGLPASAPHPERIRAREAA